MNELFWAKVDRSDSCWLWIGARSGDYGQIKWEGRVQWAHRVSYQLAHGPIPVGLEIDHLCRNPRCVNPDHLEAVTHRENLIRGSGFANQARATHCARGHAYDEANVYRRPDQPWTRLCRECYRARARRYAKARKQAA